MSSSRGVRILSRHQYAGTPSPASTYRPLPPAPSSLRLSPVFPRTRALTPRTPSPHLNTHGKWHLHTSHVAVGLGHTSLLLIQSVHSLMTPASDPPLPESSHPNTCTPALPLCLSWYLANCFQEIVGNRMIRGRSRRESSGKRGPEGPVREAAAEEKEEEEKEEGGEKDE